MPTYSARVPTSALLVGPHNQFVRNGITLNDRSLMEGYWITGMTGFDSADVDISYDPNAQQDGELANPGFHRGRSMSMTGHIRAGNYPKLLELGEALLSSLVTIEEMEMIIKVSPWTVMLTQPEVSIFCRKSDRPQLSMEIKQEDRSGLLKRDFTIALKASDATYKSTQLHTASLVPTSVAQRGRVYPRVYPLVYETYLDPQGNPTPAGNQITVHNDGNYDVAPILRFTGGMSGVSLINGSNGQRINLSRPIDTGDFIEVDVANGLAYDSAGISRADVFGSSSDWMRLAGKRDGASGDNDLQLLVSAFDSYARLSVTWRDTWI